MRIGIGHSVLTITTELNLIWPCFQSQFLHKHCYYLLFFRPRLLFCAFDQTDLFKRYASFARKLLTLYYTVI